MKTLVELNVPFNNNSHTVLKGALLTGAVPLIFKLNLKFYSQANDDIMCISPYFSQNM